MELSDLSGIGKTRLSALNKAGILSCEDLIKYLPRKYYDFMSPLPALPSDGYKMVRGKVKSDPKTAHIKKNFSITSVCMVDSFGNEFSAIWYNQPYVSHAVLVDNEYYIYGKDDKKKKNSIVVSYFKDASKTDNIGLFPIYPRIESLPSEVIRHAISDALAEVNIKSIISNRAEKEFNLLSLSDAYNFCHLPENIGALNRAKERIEIENIIPLAYACISCKKIGREQRVHTYNSFVDSLNEYKNLLPFNLTKSQNNALQEVISDLGSDLSMNRLLEGDVGSGKTAVALFCMYLAFRNGYQSVMMAPTEILARQHYEFACKIFNNIFGLRVVFLSSKLTLKEKKYVLSMIASGEANIIIGSHSVFSKAVKYNNLALAIIDEQHKFGVKARGELAGKGVAVDVLTMSATPIPRSLALSLNGTLDISVLEARPHALDVKTNIVSKYKLDDMWKFIDEKVSNGSKVFVVCPKIEENDDDDGLEGSSVKSVFSELQSKLKSKISMIHGKMNCDDIENIIEGFKNGDTGVLVSTTIVEVGVDAKDADIIVIMNAHSFGLASLHQLRGRVGRDGKSAMCFCVVPQNVSTLALDRLKFFKNNTDGFKIAEYDLKLRGAGDMDGTTQHGFNNYFAGVTTIGLDYAKKIVISMEEHNEPVDISNEYCSSIYEKMLGNIALN